MCLVHNFLIRGLNTIYLQAPHVQPTDYKDFIAYSIIWCDVVDGQCEQLTLEIRLTEIFSDHHRSEEAVIFPQIEEAVGQKGLMAGNIKEHRKSIHGLRVPSSSLIEIFHPGLEAMKVYLEGLKDNETTFSGSHLCKLVDAFGPALSVHLASEIPTLVGLARFGKKIPLRDIWEKEGERNMKGLGKTTVLPFVFLNWDVTFEDGIWNGWPPIPGFVRWAFCNVLTLRHSGYWKFAACDGNEMPKALHAMQGGK